MKFNYIFVASNQLDFYLLVCSGIKYFYRRLWCHYNDVVVNFEIHDHIHDPGTKFLSFQKSCHVRSSRHNHGWRCTSELATRADVSTFLCSHLTVTNEKLICDDLLFIAAAGSWQYENNYTSASSSETNNLVLQTWPIFKILKIKKYVNEKSGISVQTLRTVSGD